MLSWSQASAILLAYLVFANATQASETVTLRLSSGSLGGAVTSRSVPTRKALGPLMPQTTRRAFPVGGEPNGIVSLPRTSTVNAITPKTALTPNSTVSKTAGDATNFAYGTGQLLWPYTTSRVASSTANATSEVQDNPVSSTPFRQTGLLLTGFSEGIAQCTASLILPNVIVTAAHCVQHYGMAGSGGIMGAVWVPAATASPFDRLATTPGPFGVWEAATAVVPSSYYYGTDTCAKEAPGVACKNDLAVLSLVPLGGQKAGAVLGGTYTYSSNGYSFVQSKAFKNTIVADVTQLGYPGAFDDGNQMQRNNSFGRYIVTRGRTTSRRPLLGIQLGSALTAGASGGPILVNFGTTPSVTGEANLGYESFGNVVVGVTSYGYSEVGVNVQGATFFGQNFEYPLADYGGFGAGNIGALVQTVCGLDPASCLN